MQEGSEASQTFVRTRSSNHSLQGRAALQKHSGPGLLHSAGCGERGGTQQASRRAHMHSARRGAAQGAPCLACRATPVRRACASPGARMKVVGAVLERQRRTFSEKLGME